MNQIDDDEDLGSGVLNKETILALINSLRAFKEKNGSGEFSRKELEKVIDWATETTLNANLLDMVVNGEADLNLINDEISFEDPVSSIN